MTHFDHGTQRAILRLYRSSPSATLAKAGEHLSRLTMPSLVLWGKQDPYIPERFAHEYAQGVAGQRTGGAGWRRALVVVGQARGDRAGVRLSDGRLRCADAGARAARRGPAHPRLPDRRAARWRPGRRHLSQRPVRPRRLHDLGHGLVRRTRPLAACVFAVRRPRLEHCWASVCCLPSRPSPPRSCSR